MRYLHLCAHEQSPPDQLLRQAVAAEAAGFDGIGCSDHLQPWWEPGEAGHAWVWLGAAAQATERPLFGTAVTPPGPRYHPVLIAQAWATFELMFPGRPYLGVGSGEALNEFPVSGDRPPIYVSAFGPKAAAVAGRQGDGLWTLADPESTPGIIDAYRAAAEDAGRQPGEIVLQAAFSWAPDDEAALAGARVWKGAQPKEF